MTSMIGADVAELRALAAQFSSSAQRLTTSASRVSNGIRISAWVGPFAANFRATWDSDHSVRLKSAARALDDAARALNAQAAEQERASASGGGSVARGPAGSPVVEDGPPMASAYSVETLVGNLEKLGSDGVRIEEVVGPDGKTRYIVYIGGTGYAGDPFNSDNLLDWGENVDAMQGKPTQTEDYVRAMMKAAGIGSDSDVLFVGYSQGGIYAQNLARSDDFGHAMVITKASPQVPGGMGDVDILRLEVRGDLVVEKAGVANHVNDVVQGLGLSGETGIDTKLTTGSAVGAAVAGVAGGPTGTAACGAGVHMDQAAYLAAANEFDHSTDPVHQEFQRRLQDFQPGYVPANHPTF